MEKQYLTVKQFQDNGGILKPDMLLYIDHPKYGFDSCSEVRYNNIKGREHEFYVEIEEK